MEDGLRLQKTVCENGTERETHYIWNEGRLIAEYDDTQAITVLYDSENSPVGFTVETGEAPNKSTATYIYLKNLQGDITHILDEDGETVVSYTYDPWGNPTIQGNTSIAAINPCSYRGYYYDEETGWYYLQSRYYDPEIGRFLNADDPMTIDDNGLLSNNNVYIYCNNSPIDKYDYNGYYAIYVSTRLRNLMQNNAQYLYNYAEPRVPFILGALMWTKKIIIIAKFVSLVKSKGPWDLRNKPEWKLKPGNSYTFYSLTGLSAEDIGNIHFGFVGSVLFSERMLCTGSGLYQIYSEGKIHWSDWKSYFDQARDIYCIKLGRAYWRIFFKKWAYQW